MRQPDRHRTNYLHVDAGLLVAIAAGDLDGDGKPELILGGNMGTLTIAHYQGAGLASDQALFLGSNSAHQIAVADLDGDGALDILATISLLGNGFAGGGLGVVLNAGGKYLGTGHDVGLHATGLAVGDLDGDSQPDVVVVVPAPDRYIRVFFNHGGVLDKHVDYPISGGDGTVAIGDFDGDGWRDIAVAVVGEAGFSPGDAVLLFHNLGNGGFAPAAPLTLPAPPNAIAVADLDVDGTMDIAVSVAKAVSVFHAQGGGTFSARVDYGSGVAFGPLVAADLDADGAPDLAVLGDNSVKVFRNTGKGLFAAYSEYPTGKAPMALTATDLNGDGRLDLAVANWTGGGVSVLLGKCW